MKALALMLTLALPSSLVHASCLEKFQKISEKREKNKKITGAVVLGTIVIEAGLLNANDAQAEGGGMTSGEKAFNYGTIATGAGIMLILSMRTAKVNRIIELITDAERFVQSGGAIHEGSKMKKEYHALWKAYDHYLKKARGEAIDISRFAAGIKKANERNYACGIWYNDKIPKPKKVVEVMLNYID